ncbi:13549_t:CDS:2 [Funneliformis caledonium]|uniref:13549_t:CDS:1 n=1 Tax=Funneliformis caledonium TaxID=1117310 RepID=A0A9N9DLI9_9GLOM|nr:13549_t:CDS:2 [Funneliformis caledonium]
MTLINLLSETRIGFETITNTSTLTTNGFEDVNVKAFRTLLNVNYDYVCWIRESTEKYWLRILDDRLLKFLFSTYYINSEHIFVVFRPKGQPSPNTSLSDTSFSNEVDAIASFQGLSLSTASVDNEIEPFTQTSLKELNPSEVMTIKNIAVNWSSFSDFITSKLGEGVSLFNISLSAEMRNREFATIQLTHPIWTHYILRENKGADDLLELFASTCEKIMSYEIELKKLGNPTAKFFFSDVYFSEEEIEYLLNFPTTSGLPVSRLLEVALSDKMDSYQLCSSYDLAPLYNKYLTCERVFKKKKISRII